MVKNFKDKLHEIIFEADTREGKLFDVVLLVIIIVSVVLVMLESVPGIRKNHGDTLVLLEWIITVIFTLEYFVRILVVKSRGDTFLVFTE